MSEPLTTYFDALVRHETDLWNAVDRRMTGEVVRMGRLQVLRLIASAEGGARVQDIADGVGTTIGAASRLVERLLGDGLVDRAPDPVDRRSVRVTLTQAGGTALADSLARFEAVLAEALAGVDPEALRDGIAAIQRMQAALEVAR
jgi:DNA-binding MarR family transcriptional regulator